MYILLPLGETGTSTKGDIPMSLMNFYNFSSQNNTAGFDVISEDSKMSLVLDVFAKVTCMVILIVGIIGNSLVLMVFGSRWTKLNSFEVYMISLATADLIATIMYPSKMLYESLGGNFHVISTSGCTVIDVISTTSVAVSSFTLVVISCERYMVVKWPFSGRHSNTKLLVVVMVTWLLGIVFSCFLYLKEGREVLYAQNNVVQNNVEQINVEVCRMNFTTISEFKTFTFTLFITQTGLPLMLITCVYGFTIYELNKPKIIENRQHIGHSRYNRKATKLLVVVVLVFFTSITPEKTLYLVYTFDYDFMEPKTFEALHTILAMLFMTSSCCNPIIYAKLHTSFRRCTLRMFCPRFNKVDPKNKPQIRERSGMV